MKHIRARMAEGATLDDCKLVIDYKAAEWGHDVKMSAYLRPRTLFIPAHFEEYLSAAIRWIEMGRPRLGNGNRNVDDDLAAAEKWATEER
jgi:uncharacterized phage protein (TIGR02220 family)